MGRGHSYAVRIGLNRGWRDIVCYNIQLLQAVKLFLEMNRVTLSWKIIRRGDPTGNRAADDRGPNLEELQRLVEYPDPRIKSLVYTMASSGIRLGAWDFLRWTEEGSCLGQEHRG